ncbi:UDP-glycosyltransferase 85C2-like protein [Tanacetum coccineum]
MGSLVINGHKKPHVICVALPAQSHVKAMLKLAQLLHHKGLQITFVNTEHIHKRMLKSGCCLDSSSDFRFESIPDGIPRKSEDDDVSHLLMQYLETAFLAPFLDLVSKLVTPPTCIISDGFMSTFSVDAAQKLGIPNMLYWTVSACGFMGTYQAKNVIDKGLAPLKDESYLTNGYLDTVIDWIPGMEGIRLKDLLSILWTTDPNNVLASCIKVTQKSHDVSHNIFHTFDALEPSIVDALSSMYPKVYTVGPMQLLLNQMPKQDKEIEFSYSLWKEETECFEWLDSKEPNSVMYVNYGSFTVMSLQDLTEFAQGLVNSNHSFLWIIRSNLVEGKSTALPPELEKPIETKGFIARWCSQEKVLNHPSIGGFLTHCGWGSTIESLTAGVPMICWPYAWDQQTNCRYICKEWGVGLEMGKNVKREEVKMLVQELMGEGGHKMRNKAAEWKEQARIATTQSHVKATLKLAEALHHKGLQITFVNTENIHKRMLKSGGPHCLDGSSDFQFEAFPDDIPRNSEENDVSELMLPYVETTFLAPFLDLVAKLPNPPTCIVSDGFVSVFTVDAAQKLGIPIMLYWTLSACGFMGTFQVHFLIEKGLAPPKGESATLPPEFEKLIETKGFIASWCSQEKVLNHPSVGGFLTHGGWGSTIESMSAGVLMICWPYLWDQLTNCRYI